MNVRAGQGQAQLETSADEAELSLLMRHSQDGDAQSYSKLLTRIHELMKSYIENSFRKLGLAASGGQEDVIQEILLAIHSKRSNYDPEQFFLPWLYAIARYKTIDYFRKHKVHIRSTVSLEDELANIEVLMTQNWGASADIESLLKKLPSKQREVLTLVKLEGLSMSEVSQRTGYSVSDIKVTVHRAIKFLQENVKEDNFENS